ncbi:MAG: tetraacyldisaccharide 4'-kinase [Alphaproteobacteria bacterium]
MQAPDFWRHGGLVPALLTPLSWCFGGVGLLRRTVVRPHRVGRPVICVGNLVAGGAGKTPVVLALGDALMARGQAVHFLTRGYGGRVSGPLRVDDRRHDAVEVGDEALLLAARAPTWVAADRVAGAEAAVEAGADMVIMDDGFQNPSLAKDLSVVVIDGDYGLGNGRVMPAGPLREGVTAGLRRAQAVVVMGGGPEWDQFLAPHDVAVLHAALEPEPDCAALAGKRVLAFAGIARPEKLTATLEAMGCEVVASKGFADHHPYDADEVMTLVEQASRLNAVPVTTAKDHVRLPEAAKPMVDVLRVRLAWANPAPLDELLEGL